MSAPSRTLVLARNAAGLLLGKGGAYLAGLLAARAVVGAAGIESYGLWAPCAQLITWVGLLDLGLGLGVQNLASHAIDDAARRRAGAAAGAAAALLAILAGTVAVSGLLLRWAAPGILLLPFPADLPAAQRPLAADLALIALLVLAGSLAAQIPFRVLAAVQAHGALAVAQGVAALAAVALIPAAHAAGLPWTWGLGAAVAMPALLPLAAARTLLARRRQAWALPAWRFDPDALRPVAGASLALFASQVAAVAVFQTNLVVTSRLCGPTAAAQLDAALRLTALPLLAQGILLAAVWPALAQAQAAGDHAWVRRCRRRAAAGTLVLAFAVPALAAAVPALAALLIGGGVRPPPLLVWGVAAFVAASLWTGLLAQVLNAARRVRAPALLALLHAAVNVPATICAVAWLGPAWIGWASALVAIALPLPGLILLHRRLPA